MAQGMSSDGRCCCGSELDRERWCQACHSSFLASGIPTLHYSFPPMDGMRDEASEVMCLAVDHTKRKVFDSNLRELLSANAQKMAGPSPPADWFPYSNEFISTETSFGVTLHFLWRGWLSPAVATFLLTGMAEGFQDLSSGQAVLTFWPTEEYHVVEPDPSRRLEKNIGLSGSHRFAVAKGSAAATAECIRASLRKTGSNDPVVGPPGLGVWDSYGHCVATVFDMSVPAANRDFAVVISYRHHALDSIADLEMLSCPAPYHLKER